MSDATLAATPRNRYVEDWEIIEALSLVPKRNSGMVLMLQHTSATFSGIVVRMLALLYVHRVFAFLLKLSSYRILSLSPIECPLYGNSSLVPSVRCWPR
jgi:hypothetical protein